MNSSIRPGFYLAILIFLAGSVSAQISEGGKPHSFSLSLKASLDTRVMPEVDVEAFLAEDAIEAEQGLPFRFGAPFDVDYDLYNSGTWEELPDGSGIWRIRIESEGAFSINLIYDYYYLPEGAELFVYSEGRDMVLGAYTHRNNKDHGQFATAPVKGDVTIVEYYEPANVRGRGAVTVSRVVHAYKDIFNFGGTKYNKGFGSSGFCNNNINCPEGEPWQDEKRAVAMVLLGNGTRWCSGSMVNNVREDMTPYFLSANHCLGGEATWIVMFRYESPTCENIDGPTYYTVQGTTLRANYSTSDFALLELQEQPPDSFNVYFAGWSNLDVASQQSTAIHHPSGDIKKISFDYDPVTSTDYLQSSGTTHWRVGNWEDGTTEGGSSGSPLFDQNHRVVGQLHGGYASCTSITPDWYGKFSRSWNGGGSVSNRLRDWLDPDNTGATTLDGYDPYASVGITHTPLSDTKDTTNDYEVTALVKSSEPLIGDSLQLHYQISTVWYMELLTATGNPDEFRASIPAQSAGTEISYYLMAWDEAETADTTDTFTFNVEYSPAIAISPGSFIFTIQVEDSLNDNIYIENINEGELLYTLSSEITPFYGDLFYRLQSEDALEPARRDYPDGFDNYDEAKGAEDPRTGFPVEKDAGGPDEFGYYWVDSDEPDGPDFDWIDISATGTDISSGLDDDNYTGPYALGFDFAFYGIVYSEFYLGSNGIIGFDTTNMKARQKKSIPTADTPNNILAWLWDDLDITDDVNTDGRVYMETDGNRCVIQFVDFPEYNAGVGEVVNAEVIIYADGKIKYQYLSIAAGFDIANCAIGIENSDGTDGLEVAYLTAYLHDSVAILFTQPTQWITLGKTAGSVWGGEIDTVEIRFSSIGLDTGVYTADIWVASNDPDPGDSLINIPVEMTVTGESSFVCGDANDDGEVNILDLSFIIAYLYTGGPAPSPITRADANGDGTINIIDISYLISYLYNGGPPPIC